MSPGALAPLFESAPTLALLLSAAGAVLVALAAWFTRRRRRNTIPLAGVIIAASAIPAIIQIRPAAMTASIGVALLALGGTLAELGVRSLLLRMATATPGAWVIAFGALPDGSAWVPWLVFLVILLGAPMLADFAQGKLRATWALPLFAISTVGIFLTVPDTEEAAVLVAAAAPVALLGWPARVARLGSAGAFAVIGITVWVLAWGGTGREASLLGAAACLGLLVVEPLARRVTGKPTLVERLDAGTTGMLVVGAIHFLLVMVSSRVAGLRSSVTDAAVIALLALAIAFIGVTLIKPGALVAGGNEATLRRDTDAPTNLRR